MREIGGIPSRFWSPNRLLIRVVPFVGRINCIAKHFEASTGGVQSNCCVESLIEIISLKKERFASVVKRPISAPANKTSGPDFTPLWRYWCPGSDGGSIWPGGPPYKFHFRVVPPDLEPLTPRAATRIFPEGPWWRAPRFAASRFFLGRLGGDLRPAPPHRAPGGSSVDQQRARRSYRTPLPPPHPHPPISRPPCPGA